MLASAAVPVPTGEINWNPGSGEAVLEGDTYPSGPLIDAASDCEGRPSRPGRRWRIGHCSGCRNAPPRLIIHIVNPARQRTDLRGDDPERRVNDTELRVDCTDLRVDPTDLRVERINLGRGGKTQSSRRVGREVAGGVGGDDLRRAGLRG